MQRGVWAGLVIGVGALLVIGLVATGSPEPNAPETQGDSKPPTADAPAVDAPPTADASRGRDGRREPAEVAAQVSAFTATRVIPTPEPEPADAAPRDEAARLREAWTARTREYRDLELELEALTQGPDPHAAWLQLAELRLAFAEDHVRATPPPGLDDARLASWRAGMERRGQHLVETSRQALTALDQLQVVDPDHPARVDGIKHRLSELEP